MKATDCKQLDDYLDAELDESARIAFERHIKGCKSCRSTVAESAVVARLLQHAFVERADISRQESDSARGTIMACFAAVAAVLLLWVTAVVTSNGRSNHTQPTNHVAQRPETSINPDSQTTSAPERPSVDVQLSAGQDLLAVRMPTRNKNVTIVWMYPTVQ